MPNHFLLRTLFLSGLALLSLSSGNNVARQESKLLLTSFDGTVSVETAKQKAKFTCMPKEVGLDEVVVPGRNGTKNITVSDKLRAMGARCRYGKLVNGRGREIRFFRPSCWGNPPADYLEIQQREKQELAELNKRHAVIVFGCNPMVQ